MVGAGIAVTSRGASFGGQEAIRHHNENTPDLSDVTSVFCNERQVALLSCDFSWVVREECCFERLVVCKDDERAALDKGTELVYGKKNSKELTVKSPVFSFTPSEVL